MQRPFGLLSVTTGPLLWSAAAAVALALVAAWAARPTLSIEINPDLIRPAAGQAYSAGRIFGSQVLYAVPTDSLRHKTRSGLVLFEDGQVLGPAHASHRQIREAGGGAYSHWTGDLQFSSSDGTDPRANGRRYAARVTAELNPLVLWPGLALIAAAAAGALGLRDGMRLPRWFTRCVRYSRRALEGQAGAARARDAAPSNPLDIGRTAWPFALLALVASVTVAPFVNVDSEQMAAFGLSASVPHWPALYPGILHVISAIAVFLRWAGGGPAPYGDFMQPVAPFTPLAATLTLFVQHALTLASAAYLANCLCPDDRHGKRDLLRQRLIIAVLYLNPFTLQMVHAVTSEALVVPAVYAASAEALVILTRPWRPLGHYAAFLAWVLLASLARHPAIVLGALLPIGLVLKGAAATAQRNWSSLRGSLVELGVALLGLIAVQAANLLVNSVIMVQHQVEPRSVPGQAFTYRLGQIWAGTSVLPGLDKAEFERVLAHLEATAGDPELRQDIEIVARDPDAWIGPYGKIRERIAEACPDCSGAQVAAETDRRLNSVMRHAILSADPGLIRDVLLRTVNFLAPYAIAGRSRHIFGMDVPASERFNPLPGFLWKGRDIELVLSGPASFLREFLFSIAGVTVLLTLPSRRRRGFGSLSLGLLGTAVAYSVLVSLVTIYLPRYGLFVDQLALIALVVGIAARAEANARNSEHIRAAEECRRTAACVQL